MVKVKSVVDIDQNKKNVFIIFLNQKFKDCEQHCFNSVIF